jgi:hypothetical protein
VTSWPRRKTTATDYHISHQITCNAQRSTWTHARPRPVPAIPHRSEIAYAPTQTAQSANRRWCVHGRSNRIPSIPPEPTEPHRIIPLHGLDVLLSVGRGHRQSRWIIRSGGPGRRVATGRRPRHGLPLDDRRRRGGHGFVFRVGHGVERGERDDGSRFRRSRHGHRGFGRHRRPCKKYDIISITTNTNPRSSARTRKLTDAIVHGDPNRSDLSARLLPDPRSSRRSSRHRPPRPPLRRSDR